MANRKKLKIKQVSNPVSPVTVGLGLLAVVGIGGMLFMFSKQQQHTQRLPQQQFQQLPQQQFQQLPQQQFQQPQYQAPSPQIGGSGTNTQSEIGRRVRRNQHFHLRTSDTSSSSGPNITDNPTMEILERGRSTRNANEVMYRVRLLDGSHSGQTGWTFVLPNEFV